MLEPISIALDGPVASGKTAVGMFVAKRLKWRFVDTGTMYRAVTIAALNEGVDLMDQRGLTELADSLEIKVISDEKGNGIKVNRKDVTSQLREMRVERGVSLVSKVSGVRLAMVKEQRVMSKESSIVMAGRDIGTVVLPEAKVKIFLKASVQIRANRRYSEIRKMRNSVKFQDVMDDLIRRDKIDTERADSPLRPAENAVQMCTDEIGVKEVGERIIALVKGG